MSEKPQEQIPDTDKVETSGILEFSTGLPGFEEHKQFFLESRTDLRPFLWLRSVDDPNVALPVISCLLLKKQVILYLNQNHLKMLGGSSLDEIAPYYILRVDPKKGEITANTKAPVLINPKTMRGRQVILDREDLRVDEPLSNLIASVGNE